MSGEINTAIAALSAIRTIAAGLVAMRDDNKVLEIKNALLTQVFEVRETLDALQDQMTTVKEENRKLQEANRKLQERLDQAPDLDLVQLAPGVYACALKPTDGGAHRPPYFCQACHTQGQKSALSFEASVFDFDPAALVCSLSARHRLSLKAGTTAASLGFAS